jgi:hypothetical protein
MVLCDRKMSMRNRSSLLTRSCATMPTSYRFFSSPSRALSATPYRNGALLTPDFIRQHQQDINSKKALLKAHIACQPSSDMDTFVDTLFNFDCSSKLIQKIDVKATDMLLRNAPELFDEYKIVIAENNITSLRAFLRHRFLPAARVILQDLAKHYGFDAKLTETSNGLLLDDDYINLVNEGKLVVDFGEDAHGPFPHVIAAFMMKEMQMTGQIRSALDLYQSLGERSLHYCPHRMNFLHCFNLLLDRPSKMMVFGNPSSLSNYLLTHCDGLKKMNVICKLHAHLIMNVAEQEWAFTENKPYLSKGKIRDLEDLRITCV